LVLPLIYTNAGAATIFSAACAVWIVPELFGMRRQRAAVVRSEAQAQDHGSMGILIGLQWMGLALNFALARVILATAIPWHRGALFALGVSLILLGVTLRWYAIWSLGRYFTRYIAVTAGQQVVRRGPYHWIRHPAYSGTFLTMTGVGLAMTNWASLAVLLLCVLLGHLYRVRVEEQALMRTIGQPYVEYMRHTRRFIPGIF
jgi:protein-S-isoprenylcysteine O-methyltransferase Ste14